MGETTMRFASSRSASRIGENRALVISLVVSEGGTRGKVMRRGEARRRRKRTQQGIPCSANQAVLRSIRRSRKRAKKNPPGGVVRAGTFDRRRGSGGGKRRSGTLKLGGMSFVFVSRGGWQKGSKRFCNSLPRTF